MQLAGKIAVVSGASSGLGAALSKQLVANGVRVYGLARRTSALLALQSAIGAAFVPVTLDITDKNKLDAWVRETFDEDCSPDILVNNAGCGFFEPFDLMSADKWQQTIDTNLNGMYNLTAALVPFMKVKTSTSHIINTGSILGGMGRAEAAAYCTVKYGVRGFSEALMLELRAFNIKVSCVNPGSIATDFFHDSGIIPHKNMLQPEELAQTLIHILSCPDNMLISEVTIRPLDARKP